MYENIRSGKLLLKDLFVRSMCLLCGSIVMDVLLIGYNVVCVVIFNAAYKWHAGQICFYSTNVL